MKSLVIGSGEIGRSLYNVLKKAHVVHIRDKKEPKRLPKQFDVLHICIPASKQFKGIVNEYIKQYEPSLVIIHSTVAPGTTRSLGENVVHSPVHGKHPHLEVGIKTFGKYVGGINKKKVDEAVVYLRHAQINAIAVDSPETSELSKILCTTYLTTVVTFMQEAKRMCDKHDADFDHVYTIWNGLYNFGSQRLGKNHLIRPVLEFIPGATGGHCCLPNLELIKGEPLAKFLKKRNATYGNPTAKPKGKARKAS